MSKDVSEAAPPCAQCGKPFYRTAVMMLANGNKMMEALCHDHAAEAKRATLSSSSTVVAGTEFWDWRTTQRYQRLADAGHTITHMGEVMQQVHGERPMGPSAPPSLLRSEERRTGSGDLGIAMVEPGVWLVDVEKHPSVKEAIEHRLHELRGPAQPRIAQGRGEV